MGLFDNFFGKKKLSGEDNRSNDIVSEKVRFKNNHPKLAHLDNENYQQVRLTKQGGSFAKLTISAQYEEISSRYPELKGLIEVVENGDVVEIRCIKGFDDEKTLQLLPTLWRRKSFLENCILFGCKRIVFLDTVKEMFDDVEPEKVYYSSFS